MIFPTPIRQAASALLALTSLSALTAPALAQISSAPLPNAATLSPSDAQRPDLPPNELVAQALDQHPAVLAAEARFNAAQSQGEMLRVGPHETEVAASISRRDIQLEGQYQDFDLSVSRPFRLPGKAALDRRAGNLTVDVARSQWAAVRHQAALMLGELWTEWLTAHALTTSDADVVAGLERASGAVQRRITLRDAAALDGDQASAALALARGILSESQARTDAARANLAAHFPSLLLPITPPPLGRPHAASDTLDTLHQRSLSVSHDVATARNEADRLSVLADRARADRIADPSFGLRLFSERSGMEKGAGITASIPLGGRYRKRASDEAAAQARAAGFELSAAQRSTQANASASLTNARASLLVWEKMAEAATHSAKLFERTARGYALGAIDMADTLYTQRQYQESQRSEINARGAAIKALLKLEIDAHQIWAPPASPPAAAAP